jgi:excisionase family DNA binding protein
MRPETENDHPARLLFDLLLQEVRSVVRSELATMFAEKKEVTRTKSFSPQTKRFYSMKEAAAELNLSQASVRRLIDRGLLRRSNATRLVRISGEEIDRFARTTSE